MSEHTPGPWQWYWRTEDGVANCGVFHEPREGMAYSVCRAPQYQTKDQWESDARLIAAAPDLLDALQAIVYSAAANQAAVNYPLIDDARAAIAKATGEVQ